MSTACLIVKQTPFVVAPRPVGMDPRPQTNDRYDSLWRPWLTTKKDMQRECQRSIQSCPYSRPTDSTPAAPGLFPFNGKSQSFQHPVRLFWPKSKSFDYLYSDGEALLRNFPVQATISFYEESDSEDDEEDEEWEEEMYSEEKEYLKRQSHYTSYN
ncbi:protein ripply1 [Oncorhynchus tshawytscha]|uniref:Protein ripply1 n=1 Tax=Oncorhynchus tshawytscha TaxID=74940 RepID=A0A8C8CGP8_ONCTS|nr:protein ripply1 [Oncorhynchus tshawytscha]